MGIVTAVVSIVSAVGTLGAVGAGAVSFGSAGAIGGLLYGGVSLVKSLSAKKDAVAYKSPTYQWGALQTQTNGQLPVALIYGENKLAGNRLWQQLREDNTVIDRVVAFGEGEIESIDDVRLNDMPAAELNATLRKYTGTHTQIVDEMVGGDFDERVEKIGSLKNLAYVALSLKATKVIRSDYNLTAVVKGRKVRVYSDLQNFTVEYSNNPAWCMLDFLIAYNGCAIGLDADGSHNEQMIQEFIDIESFIEAAAYCDEQVNGAPRFTFNMVIDGQSQRRDIIEEFKKACRGALVIKGKQMQLKIDKGSDAVKSIGADDIVFGSERFWSVPREENYDRIVIKYRARAHDWAIVEAIAEKEQFDNVPPIEHTVHIYGVNTHTQASALAWYYLNKAKLEKYFGYFETDYRAFDLEIGDVISLSENLMNFDSKLVKITKVIDKSDGTFGVFWREYNPDLYTDSMGSLEPTITVTDLDNIYEPPPAVQGFSAVQALNTIQFSWQKVAGVDVTYEIREGDSWELSKPVIQGVAGESASLAVFSKGGKKYFIKAKSDYGIYSVESALDVVYINDIANMNLVFDENFHLPDGACVNSYVYQNQLKPEPVGLWQKQVDKLWAQAEQGVNGLWASSSCKSGATYETAVQDIGAASENMLSLNYNFYAASPDVSVVVEIATSEDGQVFDDWVPYCDGVYNFRFFKLRFSVQNPDGEQFMLSSVVAHVDVPDRDEYYCDLEITDANTGVVIDFASHSQSRVAQAFISIPAIVANISGSQPAYCVVESKSLNSATIKAYDYLGSAVAATIDVRVKGY